MMSKGDIAHMKKRRSIQLLVPVLALLIAVATGCNWKTTQDADANPRLVMFIGVDVSGSFMNGGHFEDSIDFLAHYLYGHLHGLGDLRVPKVLFVSSIGGAEANEPKTFYPIQTFQNKSVEEISRTLHEMFPRRQPNPFTDYNAFLEQIALMVRTKNLLMRPISIVMVSDGKPDVSNDGLTDYRSIDVSPLERLTRSITIRLLYTNPVVGKNWLTKVPRRRVKIWTQDANVMSTWDDSTLFAPQQPMAKQARFLAWVKDNVDFGVRAHRVD